MKRRCDSVIFKMQCFIYFRSTGSSQSSVVLCLKWLGCNISRTSVVLCSFLVAPWSSVVLCSFLVFFSCSTMVTCWLSLVVLFLSVCLSICLSNSHCACVCVCVCMIVCACVCVCVCACVCVCLSLSRTHTHTHTHAHTPKWQYVKTEVVRSELRLYQDTLQNLFQFVTGCFCKIRCWCLY